ncbi:MAG TPA: ABC transporter ATP-binding protein [Polyangiaceae bacterium]|nr:ABC transporter ATP-binding protein [Polyangiaceae bacterium]
MAAAVQRREQTVIEIQELYKYYGDRRAIGPLSIQIEEGEIVGLLGLNGAGKTTTLRVLACDLVPTSGTVKVGGFDVVGQPDEVRARVGYLPDRPPLYDDMNVDEYLTFAARLRRVPASDVAKRVANVVEQTELGAVRGQMVGTLSHGFRQRVGIAQAIVHRPKFVVLDEPISGLDPVQIVEMRELLQSLRGEHTVIVSSHILSEISETCDRLLVIEEGRITWSGTEKQLFAELGQGMQVEVTARGVSGARVIELIRALPSVQTVELIPATEPGDGIVTAQITATEDVRDAVCRTLVKADVAVLELARRQGLESMVLKLLGGDEAAGRRRARKKRDAEPSAEPATAAAAATEAQ